MPSLPLPPAAAAGAIRAEPSDDSGRLPMVLHVRVVTGHGGGPEKTILNSPRFLGPLGYQSKLAYLHPPGDPGFDTLCQRGRALGADVISIPDRGPLDLSIVARLIRLCRELRVDVWHGHDYKSNLLGLLVRPFWPMKLVTTLHGWTNLAGRVPLYVQIDKWCLKYYRALICVSDDLVAACAAAKVPRDRCYLIHNAIDTNDFRRNASTADAKRRLEAPQDRFLLGAVGRLSPEKGFDLLIRSVVELNRAGKPASLWIAGEGPARNELEQLIDDLHCRSFVRLLGQVPDPKSFYEAMDLFVLSSVREGLPNVVLEAMALEVPVVATRVAGVPKLISDGSDGLLIAPGSCQEIKIAVERLIADEPLRRQLAAAARATVEARFSFARRMEKVAAVYDHVLGRAGDTGGAASESPSPVASNCTAC